MKGLPEGKVIALDTMIFIYHLENHSAYSHITEKLFSDIENGVYHAVTSLVTLLELLVKPKREGALKAASDYRDLLLTFPNLEFLPLDLSIAELASTLRAKYSIRTPDAILIATAISQQAAAFITNDEQLKKVAEIEVVLLRDFKK